MLGAGGAARGIGRGAVARTWTPCTSPTARARAPRRLPAQSRNGRVLRWDDLERGFGAADLIVQTTTLGMDGQAEPDWPVAFCQADAIVADIVYRPLETPFARAPRARAG